MTSLRSLLPGFMLLAAAVAGAGAVVGAAAAATGDDLRGGWTGEIDGRQQIYLFKVRGEAVTGVQCAADCRNPANLAWIESGRFDGSTLTATLYVDPPDAPAYRDRLTARWRDGRLAAERVRADGSGKVVRFDLTKTPPPSPAPGFGGAPRAGHAPPPRPRGAYTPPGPAETLTPARVEGLWISGSGPGKQNFIFRRAGDALFGMVCGPCDDTNAMAPLDGIVITGAELHFNIVHEDWGIGIEQGVFRMVSVGSIAANELHFTAVRDTDATGRVAEMTLLGPVVYADAP